LGHQNIKQIFDEFTDYSGHIIVGDELTAIRALPLDRFTTIGLSLEKKIRVQARLADADFRKAITRRDTIAAIF
jgi:hypothetical protein